MNVGILLGDNSTRYDNWKHHTYIFQHTDLMQICIFNIPESSVSLSVSFCSTGLFGLLNKCLCFFHFLINHNVIFLSLFYLLKFLNSTFQEVSVVSTVKNATGTFCEYAHRQNYAYVSLHWFKNYGKSGVLEFSLYSKMLKQIKRKKCQTSKIKDFQKQSQTNGQEIWWIASYLSTKFGVNSPDSLQDMSFKRHPGPNPRYQQTLNWFFFNNRESKSIFLTPTTAAEIEDILQSLNSKKRVGHDGISNEIIKKSHQYCRSS